MSVLPYDYESMTIAELKELLKVHGFETSGKKPTLVKRLNEADWLVELKRYEKYENMTISELKELLKYRRETTFGSKKDLIARLTGFSKKKIYQELGKDAPDTLPLAFMPTINFHLRDYGINPNDPTRTWKGLLALSDASRAKLFEQLVKSIHTPYLDITSDISLGPGPYRPAIRIMSIVYTGNWYGLSDDIDVSHLLNQEVRPNFVMNWISKDFTQLMRKDGPTGPYIFTLFNQFE